MTDAATPSGAPAGEDAILAALDAEDQADSGADPVDRRATTAADDDAVDSEPGDETEATEPDQEPEATEPTYRVKVRGQEREVPLSELLNGYSRTEDYKAKTAEVAEQRRVAERQIAEVTARVERLDAVLSAAPLDPVLAEGSRTDWQKLAQDNPAEYVARKAAYEARVQAFQAVAGERQRIAATEQAQRLQDAQARLESAIPEWRDPDKRAVLAGKLASTLEAYGFNQNEISGLTDDRAVRLADDARRWREYQAERKAVDAKRGPAAAKPVMRPGSASSEPSRRDTSSLVQQALGSRSASGQMRALAKILGD